MIYIILANIYRKKSIFTIYLANQNKINKLKLTTYELL